MPSGFSGGSGQCHIHECHGLSEQDEEMDCSQWLRRGGGALKCPVVRVGRRRRSLHRGEGVFPIGHIQLICEGLLSPGLIGWSGVLIPLERRSDAQRRAAEKAPLTSPQEVVGPASMRRASGDLAAGEPAEPRGRSNVGA